MLHVEAHDVDALVLEPLAHKSGIVNPALPGLLIPDVEQHLGMDDRRCEKSQLEWMLPESKLVRETFSKKPAEPGKPRLRFQGVAETVEAVS